MEKKLSKFSYFSGNYSGVNKHSLQGLHQAQKQAHFFINNFIEILEQHNLFSDILKVTHAFSSNPPRYPTPIKQ